MSIGPRKQRHLKRKIAVFILLLGVLSVAVFAVNKFYISQKPLFISPIGKTNISLTSVEKILKDNNIQFFNINVSDNFYLVSLQNNEQVKLSQVKDINKQVSSLQRILNQLTIEGKSFKSIDFRFSEPIITF